MDTNELLGRIFDRRYRINELIGSGGMGAVYRATQLGMNREVALKVLGRGVADSDKQAHRFKQEARASSKLQHPNTIRVIDFGQTEDGRLFLAMEYLRGETLTEVLKKEKILSIERASHIVRQVCKSLAEAHQKGIVHRDLKPDNIFITDIFGEHDFVKVLDFGIAKSSEGEEMASLTQTGFICGTPRYLSPEQALGRPVDGRSDLYSLGVILYEALSGAPPFMAATPIALVMKHIHEAAPEMAPGATERDEWMRLMIGCLLNKEPNKRPPSAAVVSEALDSIVANREPEILSAGYVGSGGGRVASKPTTGSVRTVDFRGPGSTSSPALATKHSPVLSTHETVLLDTAGIIPDFASTNDAPMARETFDHSLDAIPSEEPLQPTVIVDLSATDNDGPATPFDGGRDLPKDTQSDAKEEEALPTSQGRLPSGRTTPKKRRSASTMSYRAGRKRRSPSTIMSKASDPATESGEHPMTQSFPKPDLKAEDEDLAMKALGSGRWQSYLLAGGIALMLGTIVLMMWRGGPALEENPQNEPAGTIDSAPLDVSKSGAETSSPRVETATDMSATEKAAAEKVAAEKVAAEKAAAEKVAAEKVAAEKVAAEKVAAEKVAAEKVAAEKAAAEKAAAEKAAADKVAAKKAAADKAAAKKAAADKVAADKAAAKKAAAKKAAAKKAAAKKASANKTSKPKRASTKGKKKSSVRAKKKPSKPAKPKKKRPKVNFDLF